jgi:protein-L-isoaspartate(D-aspartate) O-methyltransferase
MPEFSNQRAEMVKRYRNAGYIKSDAMAQAILRVRREEFMDPSYVEHAYVDQPFPIPGNGRQTISAPYMYPIFYEPLSLKKGDKVLEIGAGSGYGAAIARELVGANGFVVTLEIIEQTFFFAKKNLERAGYNDVELVLGDGSLGYEKCAPYDAICVTAACPEIPNPLVEQLKVKGRLMAPVGASYSLYGQDLVYLVREEREKIDRRVLMKVSYVPLVGKYGYRRD